MRTDHWRTWPTTTAFCVTCEDNAPESGHNANSQAGQAAIARRNRSWARSHANKNHGHEVRVETVSSSVTVYQVER